MTIIYGKIVSSDIEKILDRLKQITIEEQPFFRPKNIFFLGKIHGSIFKLITFDFPPIDVEFNISNNTLNFKYSKEILTTTITPMIYALLYPITIGMLISGFIDPNVLISGKLFLLGLQIVPVFINYVSTYFYNKLILKNDTVFFKQLEQLLEAQIIYTVSETIPKGI